MNDSLENQNLAVEVPQNIEYINLKLRPYGYKSSFKVLLEGKEITQDYLGRYNITPDWENKDEYTLSIEILENNENQLTRNKNIKIQKN